MSTSNSLTNQQSEICATHPVGRAMRLIGDRWTLMIVYSLSDGPRRFGELFEAIGNVSPKTMSLRLKHLEELKLVERQAFAEIPPRVVYSLTENGRALLDIIEAIKQFGERYLNDSGSITPDSSCSSSTSPSCQ